jgi:hypothetical protein
MLADIFIDKENDLSTLEITNMATFYLAFIEAKIRIQIEEKSKRKMTSVMEETLEREKEMFYLNHFKLSSAILFDDYKENKQDLPISQRLSEKEILQYGIVVAFTVNNKKIGIMYSSNYELEATYINKVFIKIRFISHPFLEIYVNSVLEKVITPLIKNKIVMTP